MTGLTKAARALGRLPVGQMNKTEAAYADYLEAQMRLGNVHWFRFEGLKFRLADNTFYTPDFVVIGSDMAIRCDEVKGFWTDDARVKIKVAASMFPNFTFNAVRPLPKKQGGGWQVEIF